jgi:hypothetical protein
MGATTHCSAMVRGSILHGCADYITSAYPNRDPVLNNRLENGGERVVGQCRGSDAMGVKRKECLSI